MQQFVGSINRRPKKTHIAPLVWRRRGLLSDLWMSTLQEVSCFEVDMFRTFTKVSLAFTFSERIILHGYPMLLLIIWFPRRSVPFRVRHARSSPSAFDTKNECQMFEVPR